MIRRDVASLRSRFMKKIVMGLIAGSLFYDLPYEQAGMFLSFLSSFIQFIY